VLLSLALQGCGGGGSGAEPRAQPESLTAEGQALRVAEDTAYSGTLSVGNASGALNFHISTPPTHGAVQLDGVTGAFVYTPAPDFFGTDAFAFIATDATGATASAVVTVLVDGVDDPPEIAALPDAGNSPETYEVVVPLVVNDPDGDPIAITATVADPGVVEAVADNPARQLVLRPKGYGASRVRVEVTDGTTTVSTEFSFTVRDVARSAQVRTSHPTARAIVLTNTGTAATDFELTHNGRHAFASLDQILEVIRALPDEIAAEPFERKLWRYIRDNTYHYPPGSVAGWSDSTWATLNSFGWGFCSNVTSVFIQLAEAAGYEARAWGLGGHVVPEIRIGGSWRMYDPDVAIYYFRRDGNIASVADLAADPTLISTPASPFFAPGSYEYAYTYDPLLASIYGTTGDNFVDSGYPSREPFAGSRITLPAGGRLIYPGRWTANPVTYDGTTPYTVEQFRQARLEIPAGTVGSLTIPWVLWDVQGQGTVRIGSSDYAVGSAGLRSRLAGGPTSVTSIEITSNPDGIALVMMINPIWYDMQATNEVIVTGKDVWSISAGKVALPEENQPPPPVPDSLRKPRA
jgi:hypothetical protein